MWAEPTQRARVSEYVWRDEAGARAWLTAALASTDDPDEQFELIVSFLEIYEQTKPPDAGVLGFVHQLLDGFGVLDPSPASDGLNGAIYAAEGDSLNAGISLGAALLPFVAGGTLRTASNALRFIRGGRSADALLVRAIRRASSRPTSCTARRRRGGEVRRRLRAV